MIELKEKNKKNIFRLMICAALISSFLQTALSVAVPTVMIDFQISVSVAQWMTTIYSLVVAIMVPFSAFLIRNVKTKMLFLGMLIFFVFGSMFVFFSKTFEVLLIGRVFQAVGGGISMPLTQVLIFSLFPAEKRGTYMGIYGLAIGVAPAIAPVVVGLIIDFISWKFVFLIAAILMFCVLIVAIFQMKNVLDVQKSKFDSISLVLSSIGFTALLLGLGNIGDYSNFIFDVCLYLIVALIVLGLFVKRQNHLKDPFLNIKLLKIKNFRNAITVSVLLYFIMMGFSILLPLYVQSICGAKASLAGLLMLPGSLIMGIINPLTGKFYDRFGIKKLSIFGSICIFGASFALGFLTAELNILYVIASHTMMLVGIGCLMMPMTTWGMSALDSESSAHGTAIFTMLRTISGAVGTAIAVSLMSIIGEIMSSQLQGLRGTFLSFSLLGIVLIYFSIKKVK